MTMTIRSFMLLEAFSFAVAALVHSGVLITHYEHSQAGVAESVIASVLLAGVVLTWFRPVQTRTVGLLTQVFALLGTLVGIFTIVVGVGPRTVPDIVYHVGIAIVLACGLTVAWAKSHEAERHT